MSTTPLQAVVLLRHAEEPEDDAGVLGVDAQGRPDPRALSVRGWQRAGALVAWLVPPGAPPRFGRPTAVQAAPSSPAHPSHRPADTLGPLAAALGLPLEPHDPEADPVETAATLAERPGVVVVCDRHEALPRLAKALAARLGADATAIPDTWPPDRYDIAWVLDRAPGPWRFHQEPHRLLAGDTDAPI